MTAEEKRFFFATFAMFIVRRASLKVFLKNEHQPFLIFKYICHM